MMQLDLFGDLTLNHEKEKKTVKEIKKDNAAALKAQPKGTVTFKYPVTVYFGFTTKILEGEGEASQQNVVDYAAGVLNCPSSLVTVNKKYDKQDSGSSAEAYVTTFAKYKPDSMEGWEIRHGEFTMLGTGKPDDSVKAFAKQYPIFAGGTLVCDKKSQIAYVIPKADKGSEEVEFPFRYSWFGGEPRVYDPTSDDVLIGAEDEDTDEDNDEESTDNEKKVTLAEVLTALKGDFKVNLIAKKSDDGTYVIFASSAGTATPSTSPKKKIEKYSTENTQLSLLLRHIPLSPEMFAGKKEVTADELFGWLTPQHPEVTKETASFFWDEKNRLIVCRLQGASKG